MSQIILSSLGTGKYREANYKSEQHDQPITTGFFASALHKWYPEAQVKLLVTQTALERKNGQYVKEHHPEFELVAIPDGGNEAEAWAIFQAIADTLPAESRVIFDVTHGLRSLPMLGFLALSYLRVVKNITVEHVFYGALELAPKPEEGDITPVVELTPLFSLLDWAQAANRFQDTGDARLFKPLIRENRQAPFNSLAEKLSHLSGALADNRTIEAASYADKSIREIKVAQNQETLPKHLPFLSIMEQIAQTVTPLGADKEGEAQLQLRAHHAQIIWYLERSHYVQAIGLAREWLVSVVAWHQSAGKLITDNKGRTDAENFLNSKRQNIEAAPTEHQPLLKAWQNLSVLRNDLLHFGMRPMGNRIKSINVPAKSKEVIDSLPAAVLPLGLKLEPESATLGESA